MCTYCTCACGVMIYVSYTIGTVYVMFSVFASIQLFDFIDNCPYNWVSCIHKGFKNFSSKGFTVNSYWHYIRIVKENSFKTHSHRMYDAYCKLHDFSPFRDTISTFSRKWRHFSIVYFFHESFSFREQFMKEIPSRTENMLTSWSCQFRVVFPASWKVHRQCTFSWKWSRKQGCVVNFC